ncbi:nickel insertion protein [Sinorhizobium psoraleae]|uniref:DUF111 family protein n=1 Tax=Sinorhizobium psoraleae TaxID=520838 RepID=A0ABT4KAF1_9HYPH|nr:nickel insertion protein [Sinorhizobium psoraleae]MCZ4088839.1 DUF111 family protein [Sinorhizobium psoraleae]
MLGLHEVGNRDLIADIVAAATLIDAVHPESWSAGFSSAWPRGFVETAHGRLPVPAPANTLLLRGFWPSTMPRPAWRANHADGRRDPAVLEADAQH